MNILNAAASILLAAITVPLALHFVGLNGFGVWTLAQTALFYVATAETGIGPALQRFISVARGTGEVKRAARLIWSASALYTALGAAVGAATILLAPAIVRLFDVDQALRADAVEMFRVTGVVMLLALLAGGLANVLQGLERFVAATVATTVAAVVFLIAAPILLAADYGLKGLALAALAQQAVGVVVRVWMIRDVLASARPGWITRGEARELVSFSARLQVNVASTLINSQTDKLVVGLVASNATLGAVGIASQAAEAVRFFLGAALGPINARLAVVHGTGDGGGLAALYHRLENTWIRVNIGITALATALMPALIIAWVGEDTGDATQFATILTFGYCVSVLSGPALAYLRAIGRINPEALLGLGLIAANVVLTVVLGIAFGAIGVVTATSIAYTVITIVFFWRVHPILPPRPAEDPPAVQPRVIAAALGTAALAGAWGTAMALLLPRLVALVPIGLGAAVALAAFVVLTTDGLEELGIRLPRRRRA